MKTSKKGRIILQTGDYRVGNFVFRKEHSYILVVATSGIASWRVSRELSVAMLITMAIDERKDDWLRTYAASTFSQLCVVPDADFLLKHAELVNNQVSAHPEYYGKEPPTDDKAEDDRILEEERELHEAVNR